MRGAAWIPSVDVTRSKQPPVTATQKRCLSLLKKQGVTPASDADVFLAYTGCDLFFAAERLLTDTRGGSDRQRLAAAAGALGGSYSPVITFSDSFSNNRLDGPSVARTFAYTQSCSCFAYNGALTTMH